MMLRLEARKAWPVVNRVIQLGCLLSITATANATQMLEWYSVPANPVEPPPAIRPQATPRPSKTPTVTTPVPVDKPKKPEALSPSAQQYAPMIADVAAQYAVDPLLVHAVVRAESAYRPSAVSNKGAIGLMQVIPATGRRFGKTELNNPRDNLEAGAAYLKWLIERFDGRLDLALAGYNAGEGAVARYADQIPPYAETRQYVSKVLSYYASAKGTAANPHTMPMWTAAPPSLAKRPAPTPSQGVHDMSRLLQLFIGGSTPAQ
ncbi:lytic transglycosylase domain-containing protein [Chitinimonas sp. PSY-7]|uniref:transglycosylase SLT domain-containing protein n=1 Tax=Chitinimonas sp. PSY-7 TaxID=3459088 RepID=UPI0040402F96